MVHVIAERPHPLAGWRASRVEVTEIWNSDQVEKRKVSCKQLLLLPGRGGVTSVVFSLLQMLVGFISKLSRSLAVVDCATREVTFDPQVCVGTGYRPQTGDWVIVEVKSVTCESCDGEADEDEEGEEEEEVEYVQPLREREIEGHVTSLSQGQGFIDDDIIFTPAACGRGCSVRVGDGVRVKCVEYRHHQASWRAISVTPISAHPHSHTPSPLSPSLPLYTASSSKPPVQSTSSTR